MFDWPKICRLAHAFLWEYSYKGLKLAQLLGQLGVFLIKGVQHAAKQPRVAAVWKRLREVSLFGKTILWRHTLRTPWLTQARRAKEGVVTQGRPELRNLAQLFH